MDSAVLKTLIKEYTHTNNSDELTSRIFEHKKSLQNYFTSDESAKALDFLLKIAAVEPYNNILPKKDLEVIKLKKLPFDLFFSSLSTIMNVEVQENLKFKQVVFQEYIDISIREKNGYTKVFFDKDFDIFLNSYVSLELLDNAENVNMGSEFFLGYLIGSSKAYNSFLRSMVNDEKIKYFRKIASSADRSAGWKGKKSLYEKAEEMVERFLKDGDQRWHYEIAKEVTEEINEPIIEEIERELLSLFPGNIYEDKNLRREYENKFRNMKQARCISYETLKKNIRPIAKKYNKYFNPAKKQA
jgi:uncharacterized protein YfbU (UPF0304 family)